MTDKQSETKGAGLEQLFYGREDAALEQQDLRMQVEGSLARIGEDYPNYGDVDISLPAGHWRALVAAWNCRTPPTPAAVGRELVARVEKLIAALEFVADEGDFGLSLIGREDASAVAADLRALLRQSGTADALPSRPDGAMVGVKYAALTANDHEAIDDLRRLKPTEIGHVTWRLTPRLRDVVVLALSALEPSS